MGVGLAMFAAENLSVKVFWMIVFWGFNSKSSSVSILLLRLIEYVLCAYLEENHF
jgi:hypothetical protein